MHEPKLQAFAVSVAFKDGPLVTHTLVGPSPEWAIGFVVTEAMRNLKPAQEFAGANAIPLPAEWLRMALRAAEGGQTGTSVVRLASDNPRGLVRLQETPDHLMATEAPDPA